MYTSKERVVRDGYLVAYAGEEMTDDEARARGLIDEAKPKRAKRKAKTDEDEGEGE